MMNGVGRSPGRVLRGLMLGAVLAAALLPSLAVAQATAIPRTPTGKPDLNGIWRALGNDYWDIEPHNARAAVVMEPGPVVPVPSRHVVLLGTLASVPAGHGIVVGGEIPYLPEALQRREENRANYLELDPEIRCYLPGVPRANYMPYSFQIFQSERKFFMAYEYAAAVRDVYLSDPGPAEVDSWMGQSVGTWEGDTFVVEVTGLHDNNWLDRSGNFYSYEAKITERYTMTSPDHIRYEVTIEDPSTFSRPWQIQTTLYRNVEPGARLPQFKCVEFVEELIYGHLRKEPIRPLEDRP